MVVRSGLSNTKTWFFLLNISSKKYIYNLLFLADFGILNGWFLKNVCYFYKWADEIKRPDENTGFDGNPLLSRAGAETSV